jgi:drug/metabolite transporter (DMT)-like permease
MDISSVAALLTALCWTGSGLMAVYPVQQLGSIAFNRLRMQTVCAALCLATLATGGWRTLALSQVAVLMVSGMIGIFISDSLLYTSLSRLGPRRNSILFSVHAPITAILGFLILDERLAAQAIVGIALVAAGVILAIAFGRGARQRHQWETTRGSLFSGIAIVLMAALAHSLSALIARPVMSSGVDPIAASCVRVSVAAVSFTVLGFLPRWRKRVPLTPRLLGQTFGSGLCGIGLGMTFLLFALAHGKTGLVATLSSVTPVLILPVMWTLTKERPAAGAWLGATLAVIGVACILNH